jgi:hydrogenase maturation protein HypF
MAPLAIMVPDLETAQAFCEIGPEEESLLTGTVRPIVLLRLRRGAASGIAPSVAGDLAEMGVMLPYTPLHYLLLAELGRPLVMTSGNLSEEPIAMENAEAIERLGAIADAFLLHDRGIYSRYDDSVVRVVEGVTEPVRRSRGYAPFPLTLPFESDIDILAVGPEQKNTFTLLRGEYAFVSQHIGDMENAETLESFERTMALYERLFRVQPSLVAYDLHPEYLSTKYAMTLDLPRVGVQHHHAHIASVTAEHGVSEPVVGIAFDGTGYGIDGSIWGGEVLVADWAGFERAAHLAYVPMPGGAAAIRRPARMAVGTLCALGLLDHPGAEPLRSRLAPDEESLLLRMIERGVNTPLTSSMGRLFDTVAAIVGIRDDARYEGEAAVELEAAANPGSDGAYEFGIGASSGGGPIIIDPTPVLSAVLDDVAAGTPPGAISARFHRAVVRCIVMSALTSASSAGTRRIALGGGVFMNRLILGGAVRELTAAGLKPLAHVRLPANDGAVSHGQAVVAWARRHEI